MNNNFISDDVRNMIVEMLADDLGSIHIFWNCIKNHTLQLCGNILPDNIKNPFEYIKKSGLIENSSESAFDVFCSRINDGIINGISSNSISIDIPMKFPDADLYSLYNIYVLFLRDKDKKIVCTHINIHKHTEKEKSERKIIDSFTSEKAPYIFGQRISKMMNKYADKNIAFVQFDVERF